MEVILPVFFVYILLLIKNSTSEDDKTTKIEPAFYPTNEEVWTPLSFQDYVTAMQAERVCVMQEWPRYRSGNDVRMERKLGISGMEANSFNWMFVSGKK